MKRQPQHQGGLYRHIRIMGLTAWAPSRRRLPFGDRLVRHPQRQAAAPPKAGFIRSQFLILNFIFRNDADDRRCACSASEGNPLGSFRTRLLPPPPAQTPGHSRIRATTLIYTMLFEDAPSSEARDTSDRSNPRRDFISLPTLDHPRWEGGEIFSPLGWILLQKILEAFGKISTRSSLGSLFRF